MESCSATLARNLDALQRSGSARQAELAARLLLPVESDHIVRGGQGELLYRPHQTALPLELGPTRVRSLVQDAAPESGPLVLFGVGAGELLTAGLEAGPVLAWERDPWMLRVALSRYDLAEPLSSGRLRLALGTDLASIDLAGIDQAGIERPSPGLLVHPILGSFYRRELSFARTASGKPRVALCAGSLFVDDLGRALEAAGFAVYTLDVERLAVEELDRSLLDLEPAFVFSINYRHGLAEFCRDRGRKLIVWEVDPATSSLPALDRGCPDAHVFTYRRQHAAAFLGAGFERVEYLPLAADLQARTAPAGATRNRIPVSFVGTSMIDNAAPFAARFLALAEQVGGLGRTAAAAVLKELLELQRREPFRFLLEDALEERIPGLRAKVCAAGGEDPVVLAGELAASERRLVVARSLGPLGLEVWGDAGWKRAEGTGTRYRGPCGHGAQLNRVYAESAVNLDIGRIFQRDIVTMRVFDVLAVGGFALVEHSEALEELFTPGEELESYRSFEELTRKVAWARKNPGPAGEIAQRGRRAVAERHSITARLGHMLARAGVHESHPMGPDSVGSGPVPEPKTTRARPSPAARFGIPLG